MVENLSLSKEYGDIQHTPDIKKQKKPLRNKQAMNCKLTIKPYAMHSIDQNGFQFMELHIKLVVCCG